MTEFDTVIKGGTIIDGLRTPRFTADIGIKDGRIATIGGIRNTGGAKVIDATGLIVAPGFVDLPICTGPASCTSSPRTTPW